MGRNILMTSGNRGIGLELARLFHQQGDKVHAICRNSSPELEEVATKICHDIDLTKYEDIVKAKEFFQELQVDILLNVAGILSQEDIEGFDQLAYDRLEYQFKLNSMAPVTLSAEFLDNLKEGSKIIMITSRMGSIADNSSGTRYGYRMSKAALNAASKSLAVDLVEKGVVVGIFHPGWVKTQMTGFTGNADAKDSAKDLKKLIDSLSIENSGKFFHANGDELPW